MKIATSELATHSSRNYTESHTLKESLTVISAAGKETSSKLTDLSKENAAAARTADTNNNGENVNLSEKAQELQASLSNSTNPRVLTVTKNDADTALTPEESLSQMRVKILRAIMESLTGKKMNVYDGGTLGELDSDGLLKEAQESGLLSSAAAVKYSRYESYYESEKTNFFAAGKVVTEDGTAIDFSLSLSMQRSFSMESLTHIEAGNAAYLMDPLVINFDGSAAQLESGRFDFDLDGDGKTESINRLAAGSGFLVFDKNGDGIINDGTEMFGTQSGNGFADLAQYDEDGNGWIDENDSIYEKLGVWTPNQFGGGAYKSLKAANVGAIALQYAQTEFSVKDLATNDLEAQVRASGVFLKENGGIGSIQQIDLTAK